MTTPFDPKVEAAQVLKEERAAESGNVDSEKTLIHHVADLMKDNHWQQVAGQLPKPSGDASQVGPGNSKPEPQSKDPLLFNFGKIALYDQVKDNHDVALVRKNDAGNVVEIADGTGSASLFSYNDTGSQLVNLSVRDSEGNLKSTTDQGSNSILAVDSHGNLSLDKAKDGVKAEWRIDGGIRETMVDDDKSQVTIDASKHGGRMLPDSIRYPTGAVRQFTYNDKGEIVGFGEPSNGDVYKRLDPLTTGGYNWRGNTYSWNGSVELGFGPNKIIPTYLKISPVDPFGKAQPDFVMNLVRNQGDVHEHF